MPRLLPALLAVAALLALGAVPAAAQTAAAGPAVAVPEARALASLRCPDGLGRTGRPVVLLVHGTATNSEESWPYGYGEILPAAGFDWCSIDLPERALTDVQVSAEHVVIAVRELARRTGRRVSIIGHSQGALEPRWAVRWWPDVRALVQDVVTLAGSNQGTVTAESACAGGRCDPSVWQQRRPAAFIAALNVLPAPAGPAYTAIFSDTDELIQPARPEPVGAIPPGAGAVANLRIQDLCPGRPVSHVSILTDAVAAALALDALLSDGPASAARFDPTVCADDVGPGVDRRAAVTGGTTLGVNALRAFGEHPDVGSEPPLACYVNPDGEARPCGALALAVTPRRVRAGQRRRFVFRARVASGVDRSADRAGAGRGAVPGAIIRFAGRTLRTNDAGRAAVTLRLPRAGRFRAVGDKAGLTPDRATVRAARRRGAVRPRFTG